MNKTTPAPSPPNEQGLRQFGWLTGGLLVVIFGLCMPWLFDRELPLWPWVIGGVLALVGLLVPRSLAPLHRGWMRLGEGLGWVNSRIILGVAFYLLVLPIGLIMRLLGKDSMHRRFDPNATSYRRASTDRPPNHFERPF